MLRKTRISGAYHHYCIDTIQSNGPTSDAESTSRVTLTLTLPQADFPFLQEFLAPDLFVKATQTTQWGANPPGYGVYGEWQLMTDAAQQDAAAGAPGGENVTSCNAAGRVQTGPELLKAHTDTSRNRGQLGRCPARYKPAQKS